MGPYRSGEGKAPKRPRLVVTWQNVVAWAGASSLVAPALALPLLLPLYDFGEEGSAPLWAEVTVFAGALELAAAWLVGGVFTLCWFFQDGGYKYLVPTRPEPIE